MQPLINIQTPLQSDSSYTHGLPGSGTFYGAGSYIAPAGGIEGEETWFQWLCARSDTAARLGFLASMGYLALTIAYGNMLNGTAETASQTAIRLADALAREAGLEISQITIRGRAQLSEADILNALGETAGHSIFAFNLRQAQERLADIGWVKRAEIQRLWPSMLRVDLEEHQARAVWTDGEKLVAINAEGRILGPIKPSDMSGLPRLAGVGAPEAAAEMIAALDAFPDLRARIAQAERIGGRRWDLLTDDGMRVRLPAEGLEAALGALRRFYAESDINAAAIAVLDLRQQDQMAIAMRAPGKRDRDAILRAITSAGEAKPR